MKTNKHIAMWSCPRSRSTVIARAFEQLDGCVVYDEPLIGAYVSIRNNTRGDWVVIEKVINTCETDYTEIIKK